MNTLYSGSTPGNKAGTGRSAAKSQVSEHQSLHRNQAHWKPALSARAVGTLRRRRAGHLGALSWTRTWVLEVGLLREKKVAEGAPGLGETREWVTAGFWCTLLHQRTCVQSIFRPNWNMHRVTTRRKGNDLPWISTPVPKIYCYLRQIFYQYHAYCFCSPDWTLTVIRYEWYCVTFWVLISLLALDFLSYEFSVELSDWNSIESVSFR